MTTPRGISVSSDRRAADRLRIEQCPTVLSERSDRLLSAYDSWLLTLRPTSLVASMGRR
jgi:hypothetical protein